MKKKNTNSKPFASSSRSLQYVATAIILILISILTALVLIEDPFKKKELYLADSTQSNIPCEKIGIGPKAGDGTCTQGVCPSGRVCDYKKDESGKPVGCQCVLSGCAGTNCNKKAEISITRTVNIEGSEIDYNELAKPLGEFFKEMSSREEEIEKFKECTLPENFLRDCPNNCCKVNYYSNTGLISKQIGEEEQITCSGKISGTDSVTIYTVVSTSDLGKRLAKELEKKINEYSSKLNCDNNKCVKRPLIKITDMDKKGFPFLPTKDVTFFYDYEIECTNIRTSKWQVHIFANYTKECVPK